MKKKVFASLLALIFVLALLPVTALASHETYVRCYNSACPGYCYVYDQPSSMTGNNLGRFNNGTYVTVYGRSNGWCYVSGYNTKGSFIYGYVHYWALSDPGYDDGDFHTGDANRGSSYSYDSDPMVINCSHPKCPGYCYCYDTPDSMNSRNLGRFNNGTYVTKYDYVNNNQGGWYYVSGYNTKGQFIYGYIHEWSADYAW